MAKAVFLARLDELGATLLEDRYLGNKKPHRVRCAAGHECTPTPQGAMRHGICRTCARRDPKVTEAAFRASLAAVDAVLLEPRWLGANTPHRVRCSKGHECSPRPSSVRDGGGVCRFCAHAGWDVLYVVTDECGDEWGEVVKVGISSGDPRPRLSRHRCDGLGKVLRLFTGLPDGVAPEVERYVIAELEAAGLSPVWGREYFYGPRAATRMLDLIDHHPAVRQASLGEPGQLLPS
ncbi:hypothetical protein ACFVH9_07225 [Streptomyces hirsutus]|uniref:hypothetical protein n=1 Tax=Streptomyces hirsutus TaxID=35620 RepID=UPI00363FC73A